MLELPQANKYSEQDFTGMVYDCGPCPYLPDRDFHSLVPVDDLHAHYRTLMDYGFRRNSDILYRPHCANCNACSATRIDVTNFIMSRSQKRCHKNNSDLHIEIMTQEVDDERSQLFLSYETNVHQRHDADLSFLYESGGQDCVELHARDSDGNLLAVSVLDVFDDAVSSVYCYFDPQARKRSLGTLMALQEITFCREHNKQWLYLGFYIEACQKLAYKAHFRPLQIYNGESWNWFQDPAEP